MRAFGEFSRAVESRPERAAEGTGRGVWACSLAGMSGWTRRLEEFVEHGHNGDADDQQRAEFDGQFLFHLLDAAFQFGFGGLKFGLDYLKVGLDLVNVVL